MDCSLCCEPFAEEGRHVPRILDCGHTHCNACIEELVKRSSQRQVIRCPDCRGTTKTSKRLVSNLPKNYKLLELIRDGLHPATKTRVNTTDRQLDSMVTRTGIRPPPARPQRCGTATRQPEATLSHRPGPLIGHHHSTQRTLPVVPPQPTGWIPPFMHPSTAPPPPPPVYRPSSRRTDEMRNAMMGPNRDAICKRYVNGTCQFGTYCHFSHPVINPNSALCRHWKKGQCTNGLACNFRHGSTESDWNLQGRNNNHHVMPVTRPQFQPVFDRFDEDSIYCSPF